MLCFIHTIASFTQNCFYKSKIKPAEFFDVNAITLPAEIWLRE